MLCIAHMAAARVSRIPRGHSEKTPRRYIRMNDRQLRYLLTVAETRNISAAARKLLISQPSLSAMILNTEEQLGAPIFDRSTTPLSLTQAGECYIDAAKQILAIERDMMRKIHETTEHVSGPLSIGCSSATSSLMMSVFIPRFAKLYPDVRLSIIEDHAPMLGDLLQRGEADLLVTPSVFINDIFERKLLSREEVILLAPISFDPGHCEQLEDRVFRSFDFRILDNKPFALMKEGHLTRELQDTVLSQEMISPKVVLETERWETCVSMVENEMAFTILPYSRFKSDVIETRIRAYSFHIPIFREISLYWRRNSMMPKVAQAFIDFVDGEFRKMK